jgi:hypothetical protein
VPDFIPPESREYYALAMQLDRGPWTMTDWEAEFLESILQWQGTLTMKQRAVIETMARRYGLL